MQFNSKRIKEYMQDIRGNQKEYFFGKIFLIFLNLFVFSTLVGTFLLYTSLYSWTPWYDPGGMQFFVLIYILPFLLLCGIFMLILIRPFPISKLDRSIPFIAFFIFIITSGVFLGFRIELLGKFILFLCSSTSIVLIALQLFTVVKTLKQ